MSSHLSVSYASNAGTAVSKAVSGGAPDDAAGGPSGLMGLFASLLGDDAPTAQNDTTGTTADTSVTSQTSQANLDINLADLIRIKLDAGSGDADPDADGAAGDASPTVDPSTVVVPQLLAAVPAPAQQSVADLIASLSELSAALAKGQAPSADLIDKLNAQLDTVGKALGIDNTSQPSFQALVAQAGATLPADATTDQQLTQKLAALSLALTPSAAPADQVAQVTPAQTAIADKLAAIAKALGDGTVPANTLKSLGLNTTDTSTDPTIKAAIAALVAQGKAADAAATAQPTLATPQLDVATTALSTKASDTKAADTTSAKTDTAAPSAIPTLSSAAVKATDTDADNKSADKGKDKDKGSDAVVIAAAVSTKADGKDNAAAGTGQQIGVNAATRLEAAATPARPAVYQTTQQQINVPQIAFEMARQVQHGNSKFQIRLDPPELGRIDVQLDIDNTTGVVNARMMVEKSETLDLMQRDQRSLQQALQQAGLDGSKTNLEFSLRQNNSGQQQQQNQFGGGMPLFGADAATEETTVPTVNLYRGSLSASGVNIIA